MGFFGLFRKDNKKKEGGQIKKDGPKNDVVTNLEKEKHQESPKPQTPATVLDG